MPDGRTERVLMTADTVGGVWTFALDLAGGLASQGIEVLLATMGGAPSAEQLAQAASIPNLTLHGSRYKLEWMDDPWQDVEESGRWLLELERQFAPDVVHLNSYGHGSLPWRSPVVLTAHSCVLSWWDAVRGGPLPPEWNRYRELVKCSLRSAGLLVAPSRAMLRSLEENYGPDLPPRYAIPNGRERSRYRPARKEAFVLTAGRLWDEGKNVAALARIADRIPWPVYLAGGTQSPDGDVRRFPACRMLGPLAAGELADWYGRAAIYALPARYEPFGLSALEAALSCCALVLSDIPSLREIWEDAALFVSPNDEAHLAEVLAGLTRDPVRRQSVTRRCSARACHYSVERMVQGYADAYCSVTERTACAS